jgi:hypothetical protein
VYICTVCNFETNASVWVAVILCALMPELNQMFNVCIPQFQGLPFS